MENNFVIQIMYDQFVLYCEEMNFDLECADVSKIKQGLEHSKNIIFDWLFMDCCDCFCGCCDYDAIMRAIMIMTFDFVFESTIDENNPNAYQIGAWHYLNSNGCIRA